MILDRLDVWNALDMMSEFMMGVSDIIPWCIAEHWECVLGSWYVSVGRLSTPDSHVIAFYFHVTGHTGDTGIV